MSMLDNVLLRIAATAAAAALLLAGCSDGGETGDDGPGGGETTPQTTPAEETSPAGESPGAGDGAEEPTITIENFDFGEDVTVKAGEGFVVANLDSEMHTFTADNGEFDSGPIQPGESKTVTIDEPGEYGFHCEPHPNMTGTITVE